MNFIITRTSIWDEEIKPIEKAFKTIHENWHIRGCTEEYFDKNFASREGLWKFKGINHKIIEEGKSIARQEGFVEKWSIELNTLEDIISFVKEHGSIIIKESGLNCVDVPAIEIYDNYRE